MIAAIRTQKNRALATCDGCSAELPVVADADTRNRLNDGQVNAKLTAKGWRIAGRKHFCPACVARQRKEKLNMKTEAAAPSRVEGKSMDALAPLRQPTREQKREIIAMLDMAYDTASGRYRGAETDKTIAGAIGAGIMPGWVAEIREDLYGPAGENDEMQAVREALAKLKAETDATIASLVKRLDAVCAAVGPRAGRK